MSEHPIDAGVIEEKVKPPQIDFYYTEHSKSSAGSIIGVIKRHDIVLMEGMGQTDEDRRLLEEQITFATKNPNSPEAVKLQTMLRSTGNNIFENIANSCIKHQKEFHIVDASWESQADESSFKAGLKMLDCETALEFGDIDEAFAEYKNYMVLEAVANRDRERAVAEQVSQLEQQNKDRWSGKSVLVIQGATHTATHREYVKKTGNTSARRIMYKPLVVYPLSIQITRALNYNPEKYISDYDYKKAFIQTFLISTAVIEKTGLNDRAITEINKVTSKISQDEVDSIWKQLTNIGQSNKENKLKDIRRVGSELVKKYS